MGEGSGFFPNLLPQWGRAERGSRLLKMTFSTARYASADASARWRMTQSRANCSLHSNSLVIRGNTGNFVYSGCFYHFTCPESPRPHWSFSANSLANGIWNFDRVSGKLNSLIDFRAAKSPASQTGLIPNTELPADTLRLQTAGVGASLNSD